MTELIAVYKIDESNIFEALDAIGSSPPDFEKVTGMEVTQLFQSEYYAVCDEDSDLTKDELYPKEIDVRNAQDVIILWATGRGVDLVDSILFEDRESGFFYVDFESLM